MTLVRTLSLCVAVVGICVFLWAANATLVVYMDRNAVDWQAPQGDER